MAFLGRVPSRIYPTRRGPAMAASPTAPAGTSLHAEGLDSVEATDISNAKTEGTVELVRENGAWKVDGESRSS